MSGWVGGWVRIGVRVCVCSRARVCLSACLVMCAVRESVERAESQPIFSTQNGWTALLHATQNCHLDIVQLLVASGANLNAESEVLVIQNTNARTHTRAWAHTHAQTNTEIPKKYPSISNFDGT